MNFLAHLYLSKHDDNLMLGNFLADFIKNKNVGNYASKIQEGIYLHRFIDDYTDNHPIVRKGTKRLQPLHRKYSPVILDIFFDYLLANNWHLYHDAPLPSFTKTIYTLLSEHIEIMPDGLKKGLPNMIANDWLVQYGTNEGLRFTFEKMKERVSQPKYFEFALESLLKDYSLFEKEFNIFFPEVLEEVQKKTR